MVTRLEKRNVLERRHRHRAARRPLLRGGERPRGRLPRQAAAARPARVAPRRRGLGHARHRRRHPQGADPERLVRRADARGRGDERADDRRDRGGVGAALLRARRDQSAAARRRRCSACWPDRAPGFWFGGRARAKWLKLLMAVVLAAVSMPLFQQGAPMRPSRTLADRSSSARAAALRPGADRRRPASRLGLVAGRCRRDRAVAANAAHDRALIILMATPIAARRSSRSSRTCACATGSSC